MPTRTQLLDLDGVGQRVDRFRFDLVNPDLSRTGEELAVRKDEKATIANNTQNPIKRTLDLALEPGSTDDLDLLTARVRPVAEHSDGSEDELGVFMFADESIVRTSHGNDPVVSLVDQNLILDQPVPNTIAFNRGASIPDAVESLFGSAGIVAYDVEIEGELGAPVAWPPNTTRLEVMSGLSALAGGHSIYFNNNGRGKAIKVPPAAAPTIFYTDEMPRIYRDSIVESRTPLDAPNQFVVISSDAGDLPIFGIWDLPASAPHSAANRNGLIITATRTMQGIVNHTQAVAAAKAWAAEESLTYGTVSFASPNDFRHDTFDVVEYDGDPYREEGWSMVLGPEGPMTHELARAYD